MKIKCLSIFLAIFMILPLYVHAEKISPLAELDKISDDALQMAKQNRFQEAEKILDYFSKQFLAYNGNGQPLSSDEIRILTLSHGEALESMTSTEMNQTERISRMTKFRFVIDAITSSHQPLWAEMKAPILTAFQQVKDAANAQDHIGFHESFNQFLNLYEIVYPSIKIDVDTERVQQLDARINFIDEYRPQVLSQATSQKELQALESDLASIFEDITGDEADPSLWWVMISTGSIIIMTLSYVGWKKYNGDKEITKDYKREFKK